MKPFCVLYVDFVGGIDPVARMYACQHTKNRGKLGSIKNELTSQHRLSTLFGALPCEILESMYC